MSSSNSQELQVQGHFRERWQLMHAQRNHHLLNFSHHHFPSFFRLTRVERHVSCFFFFFLKLKFDYVLNWRGRKWKTKLQYSQIVLLQSIRQKETIQPLHPQPNHVLCLFLSTKKLTSDAKFEFLGWWQFTINATPMRACQDASALNTPVSASKKAPTALSFTSAHRVYVVSRIHTHADLPIPYTNGWQQNFGRWWGHLPVRYFLTLRIQWQIFNDLMLQ